MNKIDENKILNEPLFHVEKINIRISGDEMNKDDGYNLAHILKALNSFESVAKKTYLYTKGTTRFVKEDEDNFSVRLMDVTEGSFVSQLQVVYSDIVIPMIPIVIENREIIWNSLKASYEFLKAKITANKEGKEVEINQTTDLGGNNINISNVSDSKIIIYAHPELPELAEKISPELAAITKMIDGDKVSGVQIANYTDDSVVDTIDLTTDDRDLFTKSTYTEDNIFLLRGKIVDGDYTNLNGRIEVIQSETDSIAVGDIYRFKVSERLKAEDKWRQMFLEEKPYYCKKRIEVNPVKNEINVIELIIVDWDEQNWAS